jgi:hypothetical protein
MTKKLKEICAVKIKVNLPYLSINAQVSVIYEKQINWSVNR